MIMATLMLATSSCASKAGIDYTMSEGIIWPGEPEKPRIKYLWSLSQVMDAEGGGFISALTGPEEPTDDPRESSRMVKPQGVFVDQADRLYVTDVGAGRVSVIDLKSMKSVIITGARDFYLLAPVGVVALPDGRVFIADADLRKVAVFTVTGSFKGFLEGKFERPTGLALDLVRNRLYVADTWGHVVHVYDLDGNHISSIGDRGEERGKLNYPTHLAVSPDGALYVSDTLNFRVQTFSPDGAYVGDFGIAGDSYENFEKLKGIALDTEGHVYVTDSAQDMVKIYDKSGRLLLFFGKSGGFYGDFKLPAGIYIDGSNRIFVADMLNRRVQAFQFLGGD